MPISIKKDENITFITLNHQNGLEVTLCTLGASFYEIKMVDFENKMESILLKPSDREDFYTSKGYFGKTIGRFSGRIAEGKCKIKGIEYKLEKNWNGVNALHGGIKGISFQNFQYDIVDQVDYTAVIFRYTEPEGELPGEVAYQITYQIYKKTKEIMLIFDALSTKDTLINLTNHAYFNLSGDAKRRILNHQLQLFCDKYTDLDKALIPKQIVCVTPSMDFRKPHKIGDYIYDATLQNHTAKGYDHCWLKADFTKEKIAVLLDEKSKRRLTISTSYPAIVCYAGCYPEAILFDEDKKTIEQYHSLCLECQYIPNQINMEHGEEAIVQQGQNYHQFIRYEFDLKEK